MHSKGILIVFDGIDGAGKTTQVKLLEALLVESGAKVIISKEPTAGIWGQRLRDSAFTGRLPLDEELTYFLNDREDHLVNKVRPALSDNFVVILDRYFYSTIAYQGILVDNIPLLESKVRANIEEPDLAFIMHIPSELAASRIAKRDGKPNEFERVDDLEKVGKVFQEIANHDENVILINGARTRQSIFEEVVKRLVDGPLKERNCAKSYGCEDHMYCGPRMAGTCEWWQLKEKINNVANKMEFSE